MSQRFLLTAAARTLSLREVFALSDEQAFALFRQIRWGDGPPVCPECGVGAQDAPEPPGPARRAPAVGGGRDSTGATPTGRCVRPTGLKDRVDRRLAEHQNPDQRCIQCADDL